MLPAQTNGSKCVSTETNSTAVKKLSKKTLISRSIKKRMRKLQAKTLEPDAISRENNLSKTKNINNVVYTEEQDTEPAFTKDCADIFINQPIQLGVESSAVKKNDTKFNQDELERTVIVKNITSSTSVKQLLNHLKLTSKNFISIRERSLPINKKFTGKKFLAVKAKKFSSETLKNCYILLSSKELVPFVMQQNGTLLNDRHLFIDRVYVKDKKTLFDPSYSVFVGMLRPTDDEEFVYQAFNKFGSIKNIRLVRHPITRVSKCFAYVLFDSKASVRLAIKHFSAKKESSSFVVSKVEKLLVQNSKKEEKSNEKMEKKKLVKQSHQAKKLVSKLSKNAKKKIKRKLALE